MPPQGMPRPDKATHDTFVVENGALLDLKDTSNRTALDIAMGVPPATGRNPFEYREKYGHESTADLLRELMTAKGSAIEP